MGDENIEKRVIGFLIFDISHIDKELMRIYFLFLIDKINSYLKSRPDLSSESFFWRRLFHERSIKYPNKSFYEKSHKTRKSIVYGLDQIKKEFHETILCLDVGCGPASQFFTNDINQNTDLKVLTVDPLSAVYKELHEKYRTGYELECMMGYGEQLDELFPGGNFHLIYSQNAIDHSQDPQKFLQKLCHILKPGGILILHGFIKEGSAAKWLGLHKWDIETDNGHLLLSNRNGRIKKINITATLNLKVICKKIDGDQIGDKYTIIYKKYEGQS